MPAFTKALYYPSIDIPNSDWLKTAVLFWDSISTIVPESYRDPYNSKDSQRLADIGFLQPIYVNSDNESVISIEDDIIGLLYSPEFMNETFMNGNISMGSIADSKMSHRLKREMRMLFDDDIHPDKMSHELRRYFSNRNADGVYYFDRAFCYIYMHLLANNICERKSIGLVTDDITSAMFTNPIRFGKQASFLDYGYRHPNNKRTYEQGLLLELAINGLHISPDAKLSDIINFKSKHKDELGLFRTELARLTNNISLDLSIDGVRQQVNDLYTNDFSPAFNNLKAALNGMKIKWLTDSLLKVSLFSVGTISIPFMLGLDVPQALLAGMGISLLASATNYNVDKKQELRKNPYSYLLATEKKFS